MGFISRLFGAQKDSGLIGYYGLADWWCNDISSEERQLIHKAYYSRDGIYMGSISLDSGDYTKFRTTETARMSHS